jgi:Flp pilus assembly protein CpaB
VALAAPPKPPTKQKQSRDIQKVLSTRGGATGFAVIAALIAGLLLIVFLNSYRNSVNGDTKSATVLVAQKLIERGSSGDVIATQGLYQATRLKKSELKNGAVSDPAILRGRVASRDILPGQQLTSSDFIKSDGSVVTKIAGNERAIAIPLDNSHGMLGDIHTGDRVDVIGGFNWEPANGGARSVPVTRVLMQNVVVLRAPVAGARSGGVGSSGTRNVVLQVPDDKAADIAFSSDNGKIWLVERPKAGAKQTNPSIVSIDTILFGTKPLRVNTHGSPTRGNVTATGGH